MKTEGIRNCPNCGAVLERDKNKCPYCRTSYFDFTNIDLSDNKPFYMKLKTPVGIITAKVITMPDTNIILSSDYDDVVDCHGAVVHRFRRSTNLDIHMDFQAIMENEILYKLEVKDD